MTQYGYLTLIERKGDSALVRCACGTEKRVNWWNLKGGRTKSCGCKRLEVITIKATVHGYTKHPEYRIWGLMVERCTQQSHPNYHLYGGRGIEVCERWRSSFENFLADVGPRPPGGEIERVDNGRGYEPGNCRWATRVDQMNNTRSNVVIEHGGRKQTVTQWARDVGINPSTLACRLRNGWPVDRALSEPIQEHAPAGTFDKHAYMRRWREQRRPQQRLFA